MSLEKLPFEIEDADDNIRKTHFPDVTLHNEGGCVVGPKKYFLDSAYRKHGLAIYNFQARKDDVYSIGVPRSGTTMYSEMVWLIGNDLDYDTAKTKVLNDRFIQLDSCLMPSLLLELPDYIKQLDNTIQRRFIRTHLPLSLMPPSMFEKGSKIVYCARNPKDVIVSLFYAYKFFKDDDDLVDSFQTYFKMVKLNWGWFLPYFEHVKEAWSRRNDQNFLFLFYEDYLRDNRGTILKIADFLDKKLTDQQIDSLIDHMNFKNFKNNRAVNLAHIRTNAKTKHDFIRKGGSGGWRNYFVGALAEEVESWIEENLKETDLRFPDA